MKIRFCFLGDKFPRGGLFCKSRKYSKVMKLRGGDDMTLMLKVVPVFAAAALLFAVYLALKVSRQEAGTRGMREISEAIAEGAGAFLMAEYRILIEIGRAHV